MSDPVPQPYGQPPAVHRLSGTRKLAIAGVIGLAVAFLAVVGVFFGDKAEDAKIGDCLTMRGDITASAGEVTDPDAEVVDCSSGRAKFTVVGRVNGRTGTTNTYCDSYFTDEKSDYFVYSGGSGYLLCLKAKA